LQYVRASPVAHEAARARRTVREAYAMPRVYSKHVHPPNTEEVLEAMPQVLMVIAPDMFRDEEYAHPKQVLERRGATVVTASTRAGTCTGRFGLRATADIALADAHAADYDAIAFVGGTGARVFFDDETAHALARDAYARGKVVSAICIAPSVLARAGLLEGRRATSFETQESDLLVHGAHWSKGPIVVDPPFVTGNGPEAAYEFGAAVGHLMGLAR
jgi:protease I